MRGGETRVSIEGRAYLSVEWAYYGNEVGLRERGLSILAKGGCVEDLGSIQQP